MDNVLVVGTGTIGEPLIAFLANFKEELGLGQLYFYKHTPRQSDLPLIKNLQKKGASLCVRKEVQSDFEELNVTPSLTLYQALQQADVVADAARKGIGLKNKEQYYRLLQNDVKGFLGQGSEKGFGQIYVKGINDYIFQDNPKYVQIASCNTHAGCAIIDCIGPENIDQANLTFIRRSSDVSQLRGVQSPTVALPDSEWGTHHAEDIYRVFEEDLNIHSTACKVNNQYMHALHAHFELNEKIDLIERIKHNKSIAMTHKTAVSRVFSFGRDHGHYGRILNQAIVVQPSIQFVGNQLYLTSFTPQDGNVILSSVKAILYWLNKDEKILDAIAHPYLFDQV